MKIRSAFAVVGIAALARAQSPAVAQAPPDAVIQVESVATQITGSVSVANGATKASLKNNDRVATGSTVTTAEKSSGVLVFSNGVTAQLGPNSELTVKQFLQDPFAATVNIAALAEEPSVSKMKLRFVRGEILVHVKHLNHKQGSSFQIESPAGTAEVRGTLFKMETNLTDNDATEFKLTVMEGAVAFQPNDRSKPPVVLAAGHDISAMLPKQP